MVFVTHQTERMPKFISSADKYVAQISFFSFYWFKNKYFITHCIWFSLCL